MINKLKHPDRVKFKRDIFCPYNTSIHATKGSVWTVESTGTEVIRAVNERGSVFFLFNSFNYDLTGCVEKIADACELTVSEISEKLGYEVKVVK